MSKKDFIPLPHVELDRDGIEFSNLGFPIGFDEERLLVNVNAVRRTTRLAGLGDIAVIGSTGKKTEFDANIAGIGSDGTATLGAAKKTRKESFVNGVQVTDKSTQEAWAHHDDPPLFDKFRYAPAQILANIAERDEVLRTNNKYKKGLMDTRGHADFLGKVLSGGLREAAKQRYKQSSRTAIEAGVVYGIVGMSVLNLAFGDIAIIGRTGSMAALWLGADLMQAKVRSKRYGYNMKDAQVSAALGQDRRIGAYTLAKTQKFVAYKK